MSQRRLFFSGLPLSCHYQRRGLLIFTVKHSTRCPTRHKSQLCAAVGEHRHCSPLGHRGSCLPSLSPDHAPLQIIMALPSPPSRLSRRRRSQTSLITACIDSGRWSARWKPRPCSYRQLIADQGYCSPLYQSFGFHLRSAFRMFVQPCLSTLIKRTSPTWCDLRDCRCASSPYRY